MYTFTTYRLFLKGCDGKHGFKHPGILWKSKRSIVIGFHMEPIIFDPKLFKFLHKLFCTVLLETNGLVVPFNYYYAPSKYTETAPRRPEHGKVRVADQQSTLQYTVPLVTLFLLSQRFESR